MTYKVILVAVYFNFKLFNRLFVFYLFIYPHLENIMSVFQSKPPDCEMVLPATCTPKSQTTDLLLAKSLFGHQRVCENDF